MASIEDLRRLYNSAKARGDYAVAVYAYDELAHLNALQPGASDPRLAFDQFSAIDDCLTDRNFEGALASIQWLHENWPQFRRADVDHIFQQIHGLTPQLRRIRDAIEHKDWDAALHTLAQIEGAGWGEAKTLRLLRREVEARQALAEIYEAIDAVRGPEALARALIARELIEKARTNFLDAFEGSEKALEQLGSDLVRREIKTIQRHISTLLGAGSLADAARYAQEGHNRFPGDSELARLVERLTLLSVERFEEAMRQAEAAEGARDWARAAQSMESALKLFPESTLAEERHRLYEQRAQQSQGVLEMLEELLRQCGIARKARRPWEITSSSQRLRQLIKSANREKLIADAELDSYAKRCRSYQCWANQRLVLLSVTVGLGTLLVLTMGGTIRRWVATLSTQTRVVSIPATSASQPTTLGTLLPATSAFDSVANATLIAVTRTTQAVARVTLEIAALTPSLSDQPTPSKVSIKSPTPHPERTPTPSKLTAAPVEVKPYDSSSTSRSVQSISDLAKAEFPDRPGSRTYYLTIAQDDQLRVRNSWCAKDEATLNSNLPHVKHELTIDGHVYDLSLLYARQGWGPTKVWFCAYHEGIITSWPLGEHTVRQAFVLSQEVDDGFDTYAAGRYELVIEISVVRATSTPIATNTPLPKPTTDPHFTVDRSTIRKGECATLRWSAQGIRAVYLNDGFTTSPAVGQQTQRVCPTVTTVYTLIVTETDGRVIQHSRTVTISGVATSPAVQFLLDYDTCIGHDSRVGVVKGQVFDRQGNAMPNVWIRVNVDGNTSAVGSCRSNEAGWYEFNLRPGQKVQVYSITVDGREASFRPDDREVLEVTAQAGCYQRINIRQQ